MIRDVVLHLNNEQPMIADLYELPTASDVSIVCTNLRTMNGKRPVFADHSSSRFVFPLQFIRFVEIPLEARPSAEPLEPRRGLPAPRDVDQVSPAVEPELEIDEDFLQRIRDV